MKCVSFAGMILVLSLTSFAVSEAFGQTVSGSAVRDIVAAYIKNTLPRSLETSLEFEDLRPSYGVGYKKCRLVVSSVNSVTMKGLVTFLVRAHAVGREKGFTQVIPVTVKIRTFQKVLVSTQTINPHSVISRDEVTTVRTETTDINNPVSNLGQLDGKWTTQWIQSGKPLTFSMFARKPLIKQGEAITIIFRTKNITVSDQGSALQDGRMGDVINVANEYRQSLRARVIGKGEVLLVN